MYIDLQLDSDSIDSEDIIAIVDKRMGNGYGKFTADERKQLASIVDFADDPISEKVKSLDDKMKMDAFRENFDRFTSEQFDAFLNAL